MSVTEVRRNENKVPGREGSVRWGVRAALMFVLWDFARSICSACLPEEMWSGTFSADVPKQLAIVALPTKTTVNLSVCVCVELPHTENPKGSCAVCLVSLIWGWIDAQTCCKLTFLTTAMGASHAPRRPLQWCGLVQTHWLLYNMGNDARCRSSQLDRFPTKLRFNCMISNAHCPIGRCDWLIMHRSVVCSADRV